MTAQRTDDELTAWLAGLRAEQAGLLRITDDSTRDDIAEAITWLRAKQLTAVIPSTAVEYGDEIDRLLAEWVKASS
jgi:hypothetical protein